MIAFMSRAFEDAEEDEAGGEGGIQDAEEDERRDHEREGNFLVDFL